MGYGPDDEDLEDDEWDPDDDDLDDDFADEVDEDDDLVEDEEDAPEW